MIGTKKAAAMMCRLKPSVGGHIINWSSMGAIATVSGVAIYQATKYDRR
jgi:short-subunit dehydrogenase